MPIRRDSRGRFASGSGGGGAIAAVTRGSSTGSRARRAATTVRAEQKGKKDTVQRDKRVASGGYGPDYGGVRRRVASPAAGRRATQDVSAGRKKLKTMERERRSLLRRGSMRGGS